MTEGSRKVFEFMKENAGVGMSRKEIAEALDVKTNVVSGSVNALVKKGLADQTVETRTVDGKEVDVTLVTINAEGLAFDPDAKPEKAE